MDMESTGPSGSSMVRFIEIQTRPKSYNGQLKKGESIIIRPQNDYFGIVNLPLGDEDYSVLVKVFMQEKAIFGPLKGLF